MKESEFSYQIIGGLESVGSAILNLHGHRFQASGWPDLYICGRWTGWVELKVDNCKPSSLQIIKMKDLLIRGVPAFVCRLKDGIVYCELWYSLGHGRGKSKVEDGMETLAYCRNWQRNKGVNRGLGLIQMFNQAGEVAIKMLKGVKDV